MKNAERQIQLETTRALEQIRHEAVDLSVMIASKIIQRNLSKEDNDRLIDEALRQVTAEALTVGARLRAARGGGSHIRPPGFIRTNFLNPGLLSLFVTLDFACLSRCRAKGSVLTCTASGPSMAFAILVGSPTV